ncbi:MAG: hypothetical protein HND51_02400 [Chloroflexi bacterium]|nr:hypothetical protein [Chloroflexota bacterium]
MLIASWEFKPQFEHVAIVIVFLVIVLRRAWMADDAFITLRTIDNFVNGYGLTWNIAERVQTYTHPLWMFLLSSFYFFTREPYFTTLIISIVISLLSVWLLASKLAPTPFAAVLAGSVLIFSNAFVDWSTSGLENPLSHLILAVFFIFFFQRDFSLRKIFWLSFVASLAGLNRLDTMVFYFFPLVVAWWYSENKVKALLIGILGQFPLILWSIFSLIYYGFLFPNTFYAKLNTGIPQTELFAQGGYYFLNSLGKDPITLLVILLAIALGLASIESRWKLFPISLGILIYLFYILRIGGDFMSGRFFTLPLFTALIIITQFDFGKYKREYKLALLALPILMGLAAPLPTYKLYASSDPVLDETVGISDERLFYSPTTGLLSQSRQNEIPFYGLRRQGHEFKLLGQNTGDVVYFENPIGMEGYYAGARIHFIDLNALGDAFLARLPATYNHNWRVAHYIRYEAIPGYEETITSGENQLVDSGLRAYYARISLIISGPIWDWERFKTIINMNLGRFDHLINEFEYRYPEIVEKSYASVNDQQELGISCEDENAIRFKEHGLIINIPDHLSKADTIKIAIENNVRFQILFYADKEIIDRLILNPTNTEGIDLYHHYYLPEKSQETGFDEIHILPLSSQEPYCMAFVQLDD